MGQHINGGTDQVLGAQLRAGCPDGQDLGVCGGVVGLGDLVGALGEDLAVFDDDRRKRAPTFGDVLAGQVDGALGEVGHSFHGSRPRGATN